MLFKVKITGLGYFLAYDDLSERKGNWMCVLTAACSKYWNCNINKWVKLFTYRKVVITDDFFKPNAEYLILHAFTK